MAFAKNEFSVRRYSTLRLTRYVILLFLIILEIVEAVN